MVDSEFKGGMLAGSIMMLIVMVVLGSCAMDRQSKFALRRVRPVCETEGVLLGKADIVSVGTFWPGDGRTPAWVCTSGGWREVETGGLEEVEK